MDLTSDSVTADERVARMQANPDFTERKGKRYLETLAPELKALGLPRGSYIIINVVYGKYVTAASRSAAH